MRMVNDSLIDTTTSLGTSTTLQVTGLSYLTDVSIVLHYSGTALDGTFKLQLSNDDENTAPANVSNWVDVPSSSETVSALTGSASKLWELSNVAYTWIRVSWTRTSGTGSLTYARLVGKGI